MSRRQFCVVGLCLALFALLYQPPYAGINAQELPPDPVASPVPTEPEQPDMAYQPPADADEVSDFLPPEGEVIEAPPAQPVTPTLPITPTTPLSLTTPITATTAVTMSTAVTLTEPITKLVSFEEGAIAVVFEEGTFDKAAEIELTTLPLPQNPLSVTNTISNPVENLVLQKFQLEVLQEGQPVSAEFSKPVRLVVDLRPLMQQLDASYQTWSYYLAYQDANNPDIWVEVPLDVYQADGLVSAEVMHFSNWAAGVRPERWNPSWTPPTVSAFSGAATYSYPLELPPGRHGLQPSVSLSYSSRGLDGRIRDGESGPIGDGWSIGDISVVRVGVEMEGFYGTPRTVHPDKFRLVFNGTGHELFPAAGANTTTDATVRYYVKDAPGYYLERNYSPTGVPNTDGIYWILITPDGTRYRMGYTASTEEWQYVGWGGNIIVYGHTGIDQGGGEYSAIAWHVDTVTDAFGNQMTYDYYTWNASEIIEMYTDGNWVQFTLTTRKNRISDIKYNYPDRVTSLPAADNVGQLTTTPATRIEFRASNTTYYPTLINSIFIYHGGGANPINEYRLNSTGYLVDSPGCINFDTEPDTYRQSHTRIVKSIQRWVNVDGNATTNDPNGYALPATTFYYGDDINNPEDYDPLRHFTWNSQPCFRFLYMQGYKNGYGGSVRFTYSSDNRAVGEYHRIHYDVYEWPLIGHSYRVTEMRVNDGRNPDIRTTYTYTTPCYNQYGPVPSGASNLCAEPNTPVYNTGSLVGYQTTTQTNYDYNGTTVLQAQTTTFSLSGAHSVGRPLQTQVKNAAGTLLTESIHTYASPVFANGGGSNNDDVTFTYTQETKNYQYNNGVGSPTLSTKTTYEYNTANQGGVQYGNLTHIREFDDAVDTTPYRITIRHYAPRTDNNYWLVAHVKSEGVYKSDGVTLIRGSWLHYDNNGSEADQLIQGALTRSRSLIPTTCSAVPGGGGDGCDNSKAYQTIETTYGYDLYGNQTSITSYMDYGYRTFNSSWQQRANIFPTGSFLGPSTTEIAYDPTYNLYPISTTNPFDKTTDFQIYGFNSVPLSGFQKQPGLLKQVTGPDSVTTTYEYDPFGRLHAVYDANTTYNNDDFAGFNDTDPWNGDPVTVYRYWDNSWNNGTLFLYPAQNAPFVISQQQRPGSWSAPTYSSSGFAFNDQTFFDGFGRPIQTRSIWHWVEGQSLSREIISSTAYGANGQVSCQTAPYDVPFYADRDVPNWPYDVFVNEACTSKPHTATTYDALGRPTIVTAPDTSQTKYYYGIGDNETPGIIHQRTSVVDANSHAITQGYNSLGQLAYVQEYEGTASPYTPYAQTRYAYDATGNLTDVWDGLNNNTHMTYDGFGRKLTMNDPDMGPWTYEYNPAGNVTQQLDANDERLCFMYDKMNRLEGKWYDAGHNRCSSGAVQLTGYTYYAAGTGKVGQLQEVRWSSSSTQNKETFNYDSLGRLITHDRWIDSRNYEMSYAGFDALHRPTTRTLTWPNANTDTVTVSYDHEGENTLVGGGATLVTAVGYNDMGQLKRIALGNTLTTWYGYLGYSASSNNDAYDATWGQFGKLWRICTGPTTVTPASANRCLAANKDLSVSGQVLDLRYAYDNVGNVTAILDKLDNGQIQNFGYDHLNRLTSASTNGTGTAQYDHTYGYNKIGNLDNYDGATYTYGNSLHKHAITNANSVSFTYDDNGNMTVRNASGTVNDYTQNFNVENELSSVVNNGSTTSFAYDAAGIRTKTVSPSGVNTYYPFPGYEEEVNGSTTTRRITYSMVGQAIALRVQIVSGSITLYYLHSDHLGSTSLATNTSGAKISGSDARYYPFGDWRTEPTANLTDRGFTGHLHNNIGSGSDDIGLIYMAARWYLPGVGRFISADTIIPNPANPQSYNRYSYVLNSPLNFTDPTGHMETPFNEGGGGSPSAGDDREGQGSVPRLESNFNNNVDVPDISDWVEDIPQGSGDVIQSVDDFVELPDDISNEIAEIIEEYPLGNQCEQCAREIYDVLTREGYPAEIGHIETDTPYLTLRDGTMVSDNPQPFHEFVRVGDTVYDSITGPEGMPFDDYMGLYYEGIFTDGTASITYSSP